MIRSPPQIVRPPAAETETDVSLRVEETERPEIFKVSGRGELHLSILIETMRREGMEFQVSMPQVIVKEIDGVKCEPFEYMVAVCRKKQWVP